MADAGGGDQVEHAVQEAVAGAEDGDDADLLAGQRLGLHRHQRGLDVPGLERQVAGDLVAEQEGDLAHQAAELGGRGLLLPGERELVLDQRVVDDDEVLHPAAPCWPLTHASQPGRGWQRGGRLPVEATLAYLLRQGALGGEISCARG